MEKCNINIDRIFQNAVRKLGEKMTQSAQVSPRVLRHIIDEGRFCEDEIAAEYYGGVLASARTSNSRDDRGVTVLSVIKDLSVYQLRFHFLAYCLFRKLFSGQPLNVGDSGDLHKMRIFIPEVVYQRAMDFAEGEDSDVILAHCLCGLHRHGLIGYEFSCGNADSLKKQVAAIDSPGMIIEPSILGAELFLWALGLTGATGMEFLHTDITISVHGVAIVEGAIAVDHMQRRKKEN